jgi:two-component system nitrogen regulation response regulator GlnG
MTTAVQELSELKNTSRIDMRSILTIDDDRSVHHMIKKSLESLDAEMISAYSAEEGLAKLDEYKPDAILLDVMLPDMSGLEAFDMIREKDSRLPVIVVTGSGSSDTAIQAMKLGAFDYVNKPIEVARLQELVSHALESRRIANVPVGMQGLLKPDEKGDAFIGRCAAMEEVFKAIGRVAPQNVTVLVRGESGTGKELVARAIYQYSSRSSGPFLAVNCAALSETLLESELFGHEKGAFTGAHSRRIGKFEQCSGGTIFLDEVGDMSPLLQGKVLRLLQEQKFERVGGNETIQTDVRIISATNRDLEQMAEEGTFRSDLYYRLNGYTITLPPLRDREGDVVLLLEHFLALLNRQLGKHVKGIAPAALQRLLEYDWPGNIRELQGILRQAMLQCSGEVLMESSLPAEVKPSLLQNTREKHPSDELPAKQPAGGLSQFINERLTSLSKDLYAETLAQMETELLTLVLQHAAGNQSEASRILGITRGSLRNKIRSHGISIDQVVTLES